MNHSIGLLVLVVHVAATLYMTGLIWFVQRVHYPLFAAVGTVGFAAYEDAHVARTGPVVGPPMLAELVTGLALVAWPDPLVPGAATWLGLALIAVIWISTGFWQVPRHRDLAGGFEASAHQRLVASNWVRTGAWSLRSLLVLWMVFRVGSSAASG